MQRLLNFVLRPYPYIVTQCGPFWSHVLTYFYHSSPAQMCIQTYSHVSFWIFGSRQHTCPNASLCVSNTTAMQLAESGYPCFPLQPIFRCSIESSIAFSYRGWHQSPQCISSSRLFGVLSSGTVPWLSLCCVVWTCSKSTGYHLVIIFHLCTLCRGLCMRPCPPQEPQQGANVPITNHTRSIIGLSDFFSVSVFIYR